MQGDVPAVLINECKATLNSYVQYICYLFVIMYY